MFYLVRVMERYTPDAHRSAIVAVLRLLTGHRARPSMPGGKGQPNSLDRL